MTNQAEFLGRMRRVDMLAAYFVHDDSGWRLKGRTAPDAVVDGVVGGRGASPSDMGYADDGLRPAGP